MTKQHKDMIQWLRDKFYIAAANDLEKAESMKDFIKYSSISRIDRIVEFLSQDISSPAPKEYWDLTNSKVKEFVIKFLKDIEFIDVEI